MTFILIFYGTVFRERASALFEIKSRACHKRKPSRAATTIQMDEVC